MYGWLSYWGRSSFLPFLATAASLSAFLWNGTLAESVLDSDVEEAESACAVPEVPLPVPFLATASANVAFAKPVSSQRFTTRALLYKGFWTISLDV